MEGVEWALPFRAGRLPMNMPLDLSHRSFLEGTFQVPIDNLKEKSGESLHADCLWLIAPWFPTFIATLDENSKAVPEFDRLRPQQA